MERSQKGMPLKIIIFFFTDFLVKSKYGKLCKFIRIFLYVLQFPKIREKIFLESLDYGRVFLVPRKKLLVQSALVFIRAHWSSHFLQGIRNPRPCLSGLVVQYRILKLTYAIFRKLSINKLRKFC